MKLSKTAERIIFTLPGKKPLSDFGIWPTQAVKLDNVVYFSGVLGIDHKTGKMVQGVRLQARQMFANVMATLQLVGMDMTSGLQGTLYLTNVEDSVVVLKVWLEECNYREYPALTVVEASKLPHNALMQVDGIAVAGNVNTMFYTIG